MAHAVDAYVHCGFCLPACLTYVLLGDAMDSPRGRIFLMKGCLSCQGCVTACPSDVTYGELITTFRGYTAATRRRPLLERIERAGILKMLQQLRLFKTGAALGNLAKPFKRVLPKALRTPLESLPDHLVPLEVAPEIVPAIRVRRARVAFLVGCAQQVLAPNFNAATLRVRALNGVETVISKAQVCCGAYQRSERGVELGA